MTKDPDRLRSSGDADARALLSAAAPLPSDQLRREVRQAVEARFSSAGPRRAAWRLVLVCAATLFGGAALAFAIVGVVRRGPAPPAAPAVHVPSTAAPPSSPVAPPPPPPPARAPARPRSAAERSGAQPLVAHGLGGPGLAAPPTGRGEPAAPSPPPPAPARLVITRQSRREIAIALSGDQITGNVRGAPVALTLVGQRIVGKLGVENLLLLMHGTEAEGTIANHAVGFYLSPTRHGFIMRGAVPAHTARVETTETTLSWYPGCDQPLRLTAPGTYEGTCAGGKARVVLPDAWQKLPALTRLILLALLLPERDPGVPDDPPALFGPPDWP